MLKRSNIIYSVIILSTVVFATSCESDSVKTKRLHQQINRIAFSSNPCDSIDGLEGLIDFKLFDSSAIEDYSMLLFNCGKYLESKNLILQYYQLKEDRISSLELMRLCECYRATQNSDSSLYYLNKFDLMNSSDFWNDARIGLWKVQIEYECNKFESAIESGFELIPNIADLDSSEQNILHEHIAYSYFELGQIENYCNYSKLNANRIYNDSLCSLYVGESSIKP